MESTQKDKYSKIGCYKVVLELVLNIINKILSYINYWQNKSLLDSSSTRIADYQFPIVSVSLSWRNKHVLIFIKLFFCSVLKLSSASESMIL